MNRFATKSPDERSDIIGEAAYMSAWAPEILEKDFWVCWVLGKVFALPPERPRIVFKGGTSLSKVYGLIDRFSEDVDLSLNRADLDFDFDSESLLSLSRKKRQEILQDLSAVATEYVMGPLKESLTEAFASTLGRPGDAWGLESDPNAADVLLFRYPKGWEWPDTVEYVDPIIRLELGARSEHTPASDAVVRPYVAEELPEEFDEPTAPVRVIDAERTFWEKVTILHSLAHGGASKVRGKRLSRHYYDVAKLALSPIRASALEDANLLNEVALHKQAFFPATWASYETAHAGSLRLVPDDETVTQLEKDYDSSDVLFLAGAQLTFAEILETLGEPEEEIHDRLGPQDVAE